MNRVYIEGISTASTFFSYTPSNRIPDFFYYPLCIGHYFCNIPYEVNRTRYDSFLLLYTKSGRGLITVDGISMELLPGSVCLVDCYKPHSYLALSEWELFWVHFDGASARSYFEYLTDQTYFHTTLKNPLLYEQDFLHLYELFITRDSMPEALLSQQISQLLTMA